MTTLITGASSGMGAEFARRFAAEKHDLALVARREDKLAALARELTDSYGVSVSVFPIDLARPEGIEELWSRTSEAGLDIDVLVNNAGFGVHGDFGEADPDLLAAQIQLNCTTLVGISWRYLGPMLAKGRGTIINTSGLTAFQGVPHMAVYGATKAFVLSFSEALWAEVNSQGIRVLAVCPGATDTSFFEVSGKDMASTLKRAPKKVVDTTIRALKKGKPSVVDGWANTILARGLPRLLPRRTMVAIYEKAFRP